MGIYWNGRLIKSVSLNTSATHYKQVINVAAFRAANSGTLVIKTLSSRRVYIDGIALSRV